MNRHDKALLEQALLICLEAADAAETRRQDLKEALDSGWNPLTNDADAFRLAVVARLFRGYAHVLHEHLDMLGGNSAEATRRAIVMAACQVHVPKAYRDKEGTRAAHS